MTEAEALMALRRLGDPKVEVKAEILLDAAGILRRLEPAGLDPFPVTLAPAIRGKTISRLTMSKHFGGNLQDTFPVCRADKLARHGYNNFMFLNLMYDPYAPQKPGHPGLFFQSTPAVEPWSRTRPRTMVLFIRVRDGAWLYVGLYEMIAVASLTPDEWRGQSEAVKKTWGDNLAGTVWGKSIRVSIHLRRTLGREPTEAEILAGSEDDKRYDDVTSQDVMRAYSTGDEVMGVWCMKCVGYDEDFQRLVGGLKQVKPKQRTQQSASGIRK